MNAANEISNARINRNKLFYSDEACLFNCVAEVKKYVKSLYGATSPQYKQVSGLKFTQI
jgi:copper chaperone CopZ